ncbi:hypothetical protein SAMN05444673_5876 [Bacillus sp. OV166]|nr:MULTISPECIES: hypothetical protein [unclassified Bacillus (in: firmicutes)]SMQ84385.1 hypothetical protein SAMN05444673_5876 [Bacillus sp. OV166]
MINSKVTVLIPIYHPGAYIIEALWLHLYWLRCEVGAVKSKGNKVFN